MWSCSSPGFAPVTINQQYVAFSFTDGPHVFDEMRVWNCNQMNPGGASDTGRGVDEMYVWYSNDAALPGITGAAGAGSPGAGWTLDGGVVSLAEAPGDGTDDGETVDLGDFTARHVLFMIDSNHNGVSGGADVVGLSEVQFFAVPEPGTVALLGLSLLSLAAGRRRR